MLLLRFTILFAIAISASAATRPGTNQIVRAQLSPAEMAQPQTVTLALRLRNFAELEARIAKGDIIPPAEMAEKYYPSTEAWTKTAVWANAHGYTVEPEDATHLTVKAKTTVAQIEHDYHVHFVRMRSGNGQEYSAGSTAPEVPAELRDVIHHVSGVNPQLEPTPNAALDSVNAVPDPTNPSFVYPYMNPRYLPKAYGIPVGLDGEGQTIVILGGGAKINKNDLIHFWADCGLPTTIDQFTEIDTPGTPDVDTYNNGYEYTMDLEIASAMAPKAKLIYLASSNPSDIVRILSGLNDPTIHQLNMSYGVPEKSYAANGSMPMESQYYAALTAMGITCFASTGDYGSNAGFGNGAQHPTDGYDPREPIGIQYPSSDPYVVGVGGTHLEFTSLGNYQWTDAIDYEGGWTLPYPAQTVYPGQPLNYSFGASTGGYSKFFARPAWQTGTNVPVNPARMNPDVAAPSDISPGEYTYYTYSGGPSAGKPTYGLSGTSLSAPIWTGLCALINQARAKAGLPPVGLLNARLYRLNGTGFNNITQGKGWQPTYNPNNTLGNATNGAYPLAPNYNLVTGLGSPKLDVIIRALTTTSAPVITTQPADQSVAAEGTVTFTGAASGEPLPAITWALNGNTTSDGTLSDGTIISGTKTNSLVLSNVSPSETGLKIGFTATSAGGTTTSQTATLTVTTPTVRPVGFTSLLSAPPALEIGAYRWYQLGSVVTVQQTAYQWYVNGVAITGATDSNLSVSAPGTYTVTQTDAAGTVNTYTVASYAWTSRQVNLSARTQVLQGDNASIVGFVITGPTPKDILLRSIGPTLGGFGIGNPLTKPVLTLYQGQTVLATNTNWSSGDITDTKALAGVTLRRATLADMNSVGAFSLDAASGDAALIATLPPGAYTVITSGAANATGIALTEAYELDKSAPTTLANMSARAYVSAGEAAVFVGIVSTGTAGGHYLIRAIGPTLGSFSVANPLAGPVLTLRDGNQNVVATAKAWQTPPTSGTVPGTIIRAATADDMNAVGAFALQPNSLDAALVATLPPGLYTAEITGDNGSSGIVLVESYQLKEP